MVSILFKWSLFFSMINMPVFSNISAGKAVRHPIFMSVTEIEHNVKDKTLEISCKIFTDDFEKTLRQNYKTSIDLINPKDKVAINKLISDYVQKHLSLLVDGKKVELQFLGYEQQEEGTLSYFQVNNISSVKKIDITNTILYEYKKEQIGIMHVTVAGNRKSTKLNNPSDKCSFEF
ncbi:DUF6702 family protein [Ferruginibacter sp.]|nr:hypothetical protein [Ferruginibacter sp.]